MSSVWKLAARVVGSAALFFFSVSSADPTSGLQWLNAQNQPNGSIASQSDRAAASQSTAEALKAFYELRTASPAATTASQYLAGQSAPSTESLSRIATNKALNGESAAATIITLFLNQDSISGGFSSYIGFEPSVIDTIFALDALSITGNMSVPSAIKAFGFLQTHQNSDGGWSDNGNESSVYITALALGVAQKYSGSRNIAAMVSSASSFLLGQRNGNGLWDEDFLSAHSLIALAQALPDRGPIAAGVTALQAKQKSNGSWGDDVYTTAVALRAMAISQGSAQSAGSGAVSGMVTLAGTTQPIAGVSISVRNTDGTAAQTNSNGFFSVTGLAGDQTLVARKAGYSSASTVVHVVPGLEVTANGLVLAPLSNAGNIIVRVVDAQSGSPIAAAAVSLAGGGSPLSSITSDRGEASFEDIPTTSYSISTTKSGYKVALTTATVASGNSVTVTQALIRSGVNTSGSALVAGAVVDASSGNPIQGAAISTASGNAVTGADGKLQLNFSGAGSYPATIAAPGYAGLSLVLTVSGGQNNLGLIKLYRESSNQSPTAVAFEGIVIDGLTNLPIANALVGIQGTGLSAVSDSSGRVVISGIGLSAFSVHVLAAGYSQKTFSFADVAFGRLAATMKLNPPSGSGSSVTLNGRILNAVTGQPIPSASVKIDGTTQSTQADGSGNYSLSGISTTSFSVNFSALGYQQKIIHSELSGPGTYTLDAQLDASSTALQITSLVSSGSGGGANVMQEFTAKVGNSSSESLTGGLVAYVIDSHGTRSERIAPIDLSSGLLVSTLQFAAGETKQFGIRWNPTLQPAGSYAVVFDILTPGSITYGNPSGEIVAEASVRTVVSETSAFIGAVAFDPPVAQAGSTAPVALRALISNAGNVELDGQTLMLTVRDGANVVHTATATMPKLAIGAFEYVSFGTWIPISNANFTVEVSSESAGLLGRISGVFYVGDKPDAQFTVAPNIVGTGNQTVHGAILVNGRDTRIGVTDPFAVALKASTKRGFDYVTNGVINDMASLNCVRCHVENQAYYGLVSLIDHEYVPDEAVLNRIENGFITTQFHNGAIQNTSVDGPKTQSALALWSLSQSPRSRDLFEVKYRAANYLLTQLTPSGDKAYLEPDYFKFWWTTVTSHNMMMVKGLVDVIATQRKTGVTEYQAEDWGVRVPSGIDASSVVKRGDDGKLYAMSIANRTIEQVNPQTGARTLITTIPATVPDSRPDTLKSFSVKSVNEIYLLTASSWLNVDWAWRIIDNNAPVLVGASEPGNGADIAIGPDGFLYISRNTSDQIARLPSSNPPFTSINGPQATIFMSGGLLDSPKGVTFTASGDLYIANNSIYLQHKPGVVKVVNLNPASAVRVGELLSVPPEEVDVDASGNVYYYHGSWNTEAGITRVAPDGTLTQFNTNGIKGLSVIGGTVYSRYGDGSFAPLIPFTKSFDQIPAMKEAIAKIARYELEVDVPGSTYSALEAMKLLVLSYAKPEITDAQLLSSIDARISQLDAELRSRAQPDGGWKNSYLEAQQSDTMATAFVGLALDRQNPPVTDPVIINALQYLINIQRPDGSWISDNGRDAMTTSSLIVAFLPRLLDRYIGVDVELRLAIPSNAAVSSIVPAPEASISMPDGDIEYSFHLPAVTANGRTISFDLNLPGMQHGESRPAASYAYALSTNSFDGSQVRVDIPVPNVIAASGLALASVTTDKLQYLPTETTQLSAIVGNGASVPGSGSVLFSIYSTTDDVLVTKLPPVNATDVSAGGVTVNAQWPTGQLIAGSYYVTAELIDNSGTTVSSLRADFEIRSSTDTIAFVRVSTDRQSYSTTDRVLIEDLTKNLASNVPILGAKRQLQILSPSSQVLLNEEADLAELPSGSVVQKSEQYLLQSAAEGSYTIRTTLKDATGTVLAQHEATFAVVEQVHLTTIGSVTVSSSRIFEGDAETCTYQIKNGGTLAMSDASAQLLVVRMDTESLVSQQPTSISLAPGQQTQLVRTSANAAVGIYSCVLQIFSNDEWKTIGSAQYTVLTEAAHVQVSVAPSLSASGTTGTLQIAATVQNQAQRRIERGDVLQLRVISPSGSTVFQQDTPLPDIAAGTQIDRTTTYSFTDAEEGPYSVHAYVISGAGDVIATDDSPFDLKKPLAQVITGSVAVTKPVLIQGESQTCTDKLLNSSRYAVSGLQARQVLERIDLPQTVSTAPLTLNVPANGESTQLRIFGSGSLAVGSYACRLDALIGGQWTALGSAGFLVNAPASTVRIDASLGVGSKGRVLVVLDEAPGNGSAASPGEPSLADQRVFIETLLRDAGWSATIVTSATDFATELHSGEYTIYAIMSESIKFDKQTQEQLREAVYRGDGMFEAGSHDQRNSGYDDALGVKYKGNWPSASGVELLGSGVMQPGYAPLQTGKKALRADLAGAVRIGRYLGVSGNGASDAAVTQYPYGGGRSINFGYDLLAEAAKAGATSVHASAILQGLELVQPAYASAYPAQVVPVRLTLQNRGPGVQGRALLTLPAGAQPVDLGGATVDGSGKLVWNYLLAADQASTFTAWVRLPNAAGSFAFNAQVQSGSGSSYVDRASASLSVNVAARQGLAEARTLAASSNSYKKVKTALDSANTAISQGKYADAQQALLDAANECIKIGSSANTLRQMVDQAIWVNGQKL